MEIYFNLWLTVVWMGSLLDGFPGGMNEEFGASLVEKIRSHQSQRWASFHGYCFSLFMRPAMQAVDRVEMVSNRARFRFQDFAWVPSRALEDCLPAKKHCRKRAVPQDLWSSTWSHLELAPRLHAGLWFQTWPFSGTPAHQKFPLDQLGSQTWSSQPG